MEGLSVNKSLKICIMFVYSLRSEEFDSLRSEDMTIIVNIMSEGSSGSDVILTAEELCDPDNEIIFVQHGKNIDQEKVTTELQRYLNNKHGKTITLTQIDGAPVYPVAFGESDLLINKKFDKYMVATTSERKN